MREVLDAARDAAIELRRIDEEAELRREAVGPQGHGYEPHPKVGILDPFRRVDDLLDWMETQRQMPDITGPIDEAWDVVSGIATISDELTVETVTRYYLQGEPWTSIARDFGDHRNVEALVGLKRVEQITVLQKALDASMETWEHIGIAHLKEMGR